VNQAISANQAISTQVYERIAEGVQRVVRGKPQLVRLAITALLAEGHLLIEDLPGLGKTTLARCLARCVGGSFHRIQFTPDLMPGDITGVQIYRQHAERSDLRQRGARRRDQPGYPENPVGAAGGDE
jgi:MoxR-like ATPase